MAAVLARVDGSGQGGGPGLGVCERVAASIGLGHVGIPYVMEVGGCRAVRDCDGVSSVVKVLIVERLMDVAKKVDEKLECFLNLHRGQAGRCDTSGLWKSG